MRKTGLTFLLILLPFIGQALDVDVDELQAQKDQKIEYINFAGEPAFFNTAEEIISIGKELARNRHYDGREGEYASKYSILRILPPAETDKRGADILYIFSASRVAHIDNIRRILNGYLMESFGYSMNEAAEISRLITLYNTVLRGRIDYFPNRFAQEVVRSLQPENIGLAKHYLEWAGASSIVIPTRYEDPPEITEVTDPVAPVEKEPEIETEEAITPPSDTEPPEKEDPQPVIDVQEVEEIAEGDRIPEAITEPAEPAEAAPLEEPSGLAAYRRYIFYAIPLLLLLIFLFMLIRALVAKKKREEDNKKRKPSFGDSRLDSRIDPFTTSGRTATADTPKSTSTMKNSSLMQTLQDKKDEKSTGGFIDTRRQEEPETEAGKPIEKTKPEKAPSSAEAVGPGSSALGKPFLSNGGTRRDPGTTESAVDILSSYKKEMEVFKPGTTLSPKGEKKGEAGYSINRHKYTREKMPDAKELAAMEGPVMMKMSYREFPLKRKTIRPLPSGQPKTVGGRGADFPIYTLDIPKNVAEISYDGKRYIFTPLKMEYLPDIENPLVNFFGKEIVFRSKDGEEAVIQFREYVSPLEESNRIMRSILPPKDETKEEGKEEKKEDDQHKK